MERSHQYTAIEGKKVHITVKIMVNRSEGFTAVLWRSGTEPIFRAVAEAFDDPWQVVFLDDGFNAFRKTVLQGNRFVVELFRQHILQSSFHCRNGQGIARQ